MNRMRFGFACLTMISMGAATLALAQTTPQGRLSVKGMAQPPQAGQTPSGGNVIHIPNTVPLAKTAIKIVSPVEDMTKAFDEFAGNAAEYEATIRFMPTVEAKCKAKAYSSQDQADAGCLAGDTVSACAQKLYLHCLEVGPAPQSGVGGISVANTNGHNLRIAAQNVAKKGAALSSILRNYADQAAQVAQHPF